MSKILIFIIVLSVLVVFHEFGHYLFARLTGVKVERFSIGMGPVLFSRVFWGTQFCFSLLPLGGYVKLAGESVEETKGEPWEFNSKTLGQKFLVVVAGPLMNALLAVLLFFYVIYFFGQPMLGTKIDRVLSNTPAQQAGLKPGDTIRAVNGEKVQYWNELLSRIQKSTQTIELEVDRAGESQNFSVKPLVKSTKNIFGKEHQYSFVGFSPSAQEVLYVKKSFFEAASLSVQRTWQMSAMILQSFGLLATGALPVKESLSGPIGIFVETSKVADQGIVPLISFMGSLSVVLFVMNLLPIPALDGGHLLFIFIEKIKGSPLKERVKERLTQGGMIALLVLLVFVSFQDLNRYAIFDKVKTKVFSRA